MQCLLLRAGSSHPSVSLVFIAEMPVISVNPNAAIAKDPEFESGVTKIQRGEVSQMAEKKKGLQKTTKWLSATRLQR